MARTVKNKLRGARSRISSKHQVTIPANAFRAAGFKPGDAVRIEAEGTGRVKMTKIEDALDRYSGSIDSGGKLRRSVQELRDEWA